MGRSGTSALARVLSLCGASLPGQLLGPNDGNPKGHWEPVEALKLNDEFLFVNGSTYHDPSLRLQETLVVDESHKAAFIERIAAFLNSCPQDRPVVLKKPRIVGLSDFWFEAARRCRFDIKVVIPVRHPGEVAGSLAKRDQASFELSNALWLKYNLLAERRSREWPRVFVEYLQPADGLAQGSRQDFARLVSSTRRPQRGCHPRISHQGSPSSTLRRRAGRGVRRSMGGDGLCGLLDGCAGRRCRH